MESSTTGVGTASVVTAVGRGAVITGRLRISDQMRSAAAISTPAAMTRVGSDVVDVVMAGGTAGIGVTVDVGVGEAVGEVRGRGRGGRRERGCRGCRLGGRGVRCVRAGRGGSDFSRLGGLRSGARRLGRLVRRCRGIGRILQRGRFGRGAHRTHRGGQHQAGHDDRSDCETPYERVRPRYPHRRRPSLRGGFQATLRTSTGRRSCCGVKDQRQPW